MASALTALCLLGLAASAASFGHWKMATRAEDDTHIRMAECGAKSTLVETMSLVETEYSGPILPAHYFALDCGECTGVKGQIPLRLGTFVGEPYEATIVVGCLFKNGRYFRLPQPEEEFV